MTLDTAIVLAALVLVLLWPLHQQLELRQLRFTLRRQHTSLHQQRRAIIQLQTIVTGLPTSSYQPMPTIGHPDHKVTIGGRDMSQYVKSVSVQADAVDQTLRLARPPARSDIEHLIAKAGRCLTATELAAQLERRPWDLLPDIELLLKDGRIQTVPGHTAGRTAYRLADATPHMVAR